VNKIKAAIQADAKQCTLVHTRLDLMGPSNTTGQVAALLPEQRVLLELLVLRSARKVGHADAGVLHVCTL
jgi:hypothetical protein